MKEAVLVVIKPDAINRNLTGDILRKISEAQLKLVGIRTVRVQKKLAEDHYRHIKGTKFYQEVIDYIMGKLHKTKEVLAMVYVGSGAVKKLRKVAGATSPEAASPRSIRGAYGRITTKGVFENVVHVSSDKKEAEREIKLWFEPDDLLENIFPTKKTTFKSVTKRTWV